MTIHHRLGGRQTPFGREASWGRFIADFLVGGVIGFAIENYLGSRNPTILGLPFRPVWGLGAALATRDLFANIALAVMLELVAFELFPVWNFSSKGRGVLAHGAIYIPYTLAYATGMLCYRLLTVGPDASSQREFPSP